MRRLGDELAELLLGDPVRGDARRLVGLRLGVEDPDRGHDALTLVDEAIAGKAGELAEQRDEARIDLLDELVRAALVDRLVTADGGMHDAQLSS